MPRAIWTGSISFGLVNVPVKLYSGISSKANVQFHMLHKKDGVRLRQKMVCPVDGDEVPRDEIVRGYEVGPDQYVEIEDEELDSLAPRRSRIIEITDFVNMQEIDPIYYDRPYYLLPDETSVKAYNVLVAAMSEAGMVGVAKFVMRNREYLVALRTIDRVICLETMRFSHEVVPAGRMGDELPQDGEATEKELKLARQLIDAFKGEFDPDQYHDEYREAVKDMIQRKIEGKEIVTPPSVEEMGEVIDLTSALEKSLSMAKKKKRKAV